MKGSVFRFVFEARRGVCLQHHRKLKTVPSRRNTCLERHEQKHVENSQSADSSVLGRVVTKIKQAVMTQNCALRASRLRKRTAEDTSSTVSNLHHGSNHTACHFVRSQRLASRSHQQTLFVQHHGECVSLYVPWVLLFFVGEERIGGHTLALEGVV